MTSSSQQKWFITFGGPSENYHNAVKRICREATEIKEFDRIIGYTEKDLMDDTSFWNRHRQFIESNTDNGYGYWIWKSYVTKKTLNIMNDNDILVYADAGCKINPNGNHRLKEYVDIVNQSNFGNFSFQMVEHLEKKWTKMDIIDYFNADETNIIETGQLVGGVYILRKCNHTVELIDKWYDGCCKYQLIDNSMGNTPNHPSFCNHRNDQSIFSVLRKKYGTVMSTFDETWFSPDWYGSGQQYPFWAIRLRQ
jgi:hypothetical protein